MNNIKETIDALYITLVVVNFLLNTGRALKAIELCKESLVLLNTKALILEKRFGKAIYRGIYKTVFKAYLRIHDNKSAITYGEKLLAIYRECGDTVEEGWLSLVLAQISQSQSMYAEAKELYERTITIMRENDDKREEAIAYRNLGTVFQSLGYNDKAKEQHENALGIRIEIGDREGEATNYGNQGTVFQSLSDYVKAKEYKEKALALVMEIGDIRVEAENNGNLGTVFQSLGDFAKAKEYHDKAFAIKMEIGSREGEANVYGHLGTVFQSLGDYFKAKECKERALSLCKNTGQVEVEFNCYNLFALMKISEEKYQEALRYLFRSLAKCEEMRGFNANSNRISISFGEQTVFPCGEISRLPCYTKDFYNTLYAIQLRRARALADLEANQYSAGSHMPAVNPPSWIGTENVIANERNCTCLYISYHAQRVLLWILKTSGDIYFREITVDKETLYKRFAEPAKNLDQFFALMAKSFCSFGIFTKCHAALRNAKAEENPEPSLTLFHEMLINPVSDLLDEPEIIIVPHRNLYRVPFPALLDKSGKYLSETFRIRIIPSLTTLKLIQDSPADYHSQTGALIVGDPDVGHMIYNKRPNKNFVPLPHAREEAEMIGRLLGVQPLLGKEATKQAVLQRIHSVSLIHIAAHGNAERGEIALSPAGSSSDTPPQEEDYLLKMSDISKVQLRAKLVVLSCCHSARGQIKAEGVVGIARAFLGSGARSVLASLWALDDSSTRLFMNCFYKHLVGGESASESLHKAMKSMRDEAVVRENESAKVSDWAPFMLIGDNVTFDFKK